MNLPNWLKSSHDPAKVSLTVKGLAVFIPTLVALGSIFGLDLRPDSLGELINELAAAAGALTAVYGLIRKTWAPGNGDGGTPVSALALLLLPALLLTGCKNLAPNGAYHDDKVLYNADLLIATSYDVVHTFVKWEMDNRAALRQTPQVTEYADALRAQYPTWHKAAMAARAAYVGNPNGPNRTALQQALDVLREAVRQSNQWLANAGFNAKTL